MAGTWVLVGTVRSVNPAKREVRVHAARPFAGLNLERVRVTTATEQMPLLCAVESVNMNPATPILRLSGGVSRDDIARMKGAQVEAERTRRERVPRGEMAAQDWIGLDLIGQDGSRIGTIRDCIESPAHDILDVEAPDGTTFMLPAIEQTVESIDLETGRVTVREIAPFVSRDAD